MTSRRRPPSTAAKLDLTDEEQRFIHDAIQRTHTGRRPLWRALAMRQVGLILYEAAQWHPHRDDARSRYTVLRWDMAKRAVSWQDQPSRRAALSALRRSL